MAQPFLKWTTFTFSLAPFAGGVVFVLTPLYANRALQGGSNLFGPLRSGAFRFSILEVSLGLGALVGSLAIGKLARVLTGGKRFGAGVAGLGAAYAALGLVTNLYTAVFIMMIAGFCNSLFLISGTTLVQTLTPSSIRGRVVAARLTVINGSLAVGALAGGWIVLALDYSSTWFFAGTLIVVASGFVWLRPEIRNQA
jgi:predicted MFS family arabinose efflux permease